MEQDQSKTETLAAVRSSDGLAAFERKMIEAPATCVKCGTRYVSPTTGLVMNDCHCGGELKTGMHKPLTPDPKLPPLGDGPRRKMLVEIEVAADFEKRLDNQWMVEREIQADRWNWRWADAANS